LFIYKKKRNVIEPISLRDFEEVVPKPITLSSCFSASGEGTDAVPHAAERPNIPGLPSISKGIFYK
jgi:hypothetical protein